MAAGGALKDQAFREHFLKVVNKVVEQKPKDAYSLIEVLSRLIKAQDEAARDAKEPFQPCADEDPEPRPGYTFKDGPQGMGFYLDAVQDDSVEERANYVKRLRAIDEPPVDEGGEPVSVCSIPDFMEEAADLAWAGAGFGDLESYKIMCSLRALANREREPAVQTLRFWGKIFGTEADYYVAEARTEGGDVPDDAPDMEAPGTGANTYTYYVTNDLCGDWTKLNHVLPTEIIAARKIKKLLTGNLKAKVIVHPAFPGNEAALLRAMIALITADTVICIKGYLARGEEEDAAIEQNPEFGTGPPAVELRAMSSWTHKELHILKSGKTTHPEIPDEEDEETEEGKEANKKRAKIMEEIENDPARDMIRSLEGDGLKWVVKEAGDVAQYKNPLDPAGKPKSNVVSYVRSLSWPGAVCAARSGRFTNMYVGYGIQAGEPDFFPRAPPDLQDEPEDFEEIEEPQGTEEADAPAEDEG